MLPFVAGALLLVCLALGGIALVRWFAPVLSRLEQVSYGAVVGAVLGTLALLPLARIFGMPSATLVLGLFAAATAFVAWQPGGGTRLPRLGKWLVSRPVGGVANIGRWLPVAVLALLFMRWVVFWASAASYDEAGLIAGHVNIWGDWPVHFGITTSFAYGENFPPEHPRFAGHPLAYHYLSDLTPAALVALGVDPALALSVHSLAFTFVTALAIVAFARRLTGDTGIAVFALVLFAVGGSLAWVAMFGHFAGSEDPLNAALARPWDSGLVGSENYRWQNMFYGFLAPQRAFLYGLPLTLLALTLVLVGRRADHPWHFLGAGAVLGLLPLAHLASMLAMAIATPFLVLLLPTRKWLYFFAAWVLIALPQLLGQQGGGPGALAAMRIQLGWVAGDDPWPFFWLKQVGLFLPAVVVAWLRPSLLPSESRRLLAAFMAIFVVANVVVFQPWDWDNHKVLVYWYLAVVILVAALLAAVWRRAGAAVRIWVVAGVATMLLSGALEDVNQLMGRDRYQLLSHEELAFAEQVRDATGPHQLFAVGLQNNHPIPMMAGRTVLMGYPGWLWTEGLPYMPREADLRAIYSLDPEADALLERYGIDHVVVGPNERDALGADLGAFADRYPTLVSTDSYALFAVDQRSAAP
ncbi:MAG TPA: hypothetical protein VHG52_10990 [Thermomicrobiales bacterium]|nr:hypothetical protein [Thermomicrobiales bacterium]